MHAVRELLAPLPLAWAFVPVPIVGWIVAQTLTARVAEADQGTDALVHTLVTSVYAVILLISALTNAIIVTTRSPDQPKSYGPRRYPAWQIVTLLLSLGWLACITIGNPALGVELVIGAAIALTSIVAFVWAVNPDPAARERRRQRLGGERARRSPEANRRRQLARVILPVAIVVALGAGVTWAATADVVHSGCTISGTGTFDGGSSLLTDCGSFAVDQNRVPQTEIDGYFNSRERVDITSRGFMFRGLIVPIAIEIRRH